MAVMWSLLSTASLSPVWVQCKSMPLCIFAQASQSPAGPQIARKGMIHLPVLLLWRMLSVCCQSRPLASEPCALPLVGDHTRKVSS